MALQGSLEGLNIPDLIQLNCQSGSQVRLRAKRGGQELTIYFDRGEMVHAQVGDVQGEEAVYELFTWRTGTVSVEPGVATPATTIHSPWPAIVMEGLRRLDEKKLQQSESGNQEELEEMETPKKRGERLEEAVRSVVDRSTVLQGAAIVTLDGLIIAAVLPPNMEQLRVGAVTAGILSLSGRSATQLGRGEFQQTLVQGTEGNIIITNAGKNAVFVGLTHKGAALGMVFLESREAAKDIAEILA